MFAALLMLLGVLTPAASAATQPSPTLAAAVQTAPSVQNELRDWQRLSGAVRHTQATATPDTWSAMCPQATGAFTPNGRLSAAEARTAGMVRRTTAAPSSRAPPTA